MALSFAIGESNGHLYPPQAAQSGIFPLSDIQALKL